MPSYRICQCFPFPLWTVCMYSIHIVGFNFFVLQVRCIIPAYHENYSWVILYMALLYLLVLKVLEHCVCYYNASVFIRLYEVKYLLYAQNMILMSCTSATVTLHEALFWNFVLYVANHIINILCSQVSYQYIPKVLCCTFTFFEILAFY